MKIKEILLLGIFLILLFKFFPGVASTGATILGIIITIGVVFIVLGYTFNVLGHILKTLGKYIDMLEMWFNNNLFIQKIKQTRSYKMFINNIVLSIFLMYLSICIFVVLIEHLFKK